MMKKIPTIVEIRTRIVWRAANPKLFKAGPLELRRGKGRWYLGLTQGRKVYRIGRKSGYETSQQGKQAATLLAAVQLLLDDQHGRKVRAVV
jgi:hypothetical protein